MFTKKILSGLVLAAVATSFSSTTIAGSLDQILTGGGCVITDGDYADTTLTISSGALLATHGTIAAGAVITHAVTFTPSYGVSDASCTDATVAITMDTVTLPVTGALSFDSITITGAGTAASTVVGNTDPVTIEVTMTAQATVGIAAPFTYSIPITLHANVLGN